MDSQASSQWGLPSLHGGTLQIAHCCCFPVPFSLLLHNRCDVCRPGAPALLRPHQEPAGQDAAASGGRRPASRQPVLGWRRPGGGLQVSWGSVELRFTPLAVGAQRRAACYRLLRANTCLLLCYARGTLPNTPLLRPPAFATLQRRHEASAERGHLTGGRSGGRVP